MVAADPVRDHRVFAPSSRGIEERAPGVQIVRPGLCALRARGPARYYGGEAEAAHVLLGALRELGLEGVRAGIADGPFTAEQAARVGATAAEPVFVVPAGGAAGFLAPLPIALDVAEDGAPSSPGSSPGSACRRSGSSRRWRRTACGSGSESAASVCTPSSAGRDSRAVEPRTPPPELHREVVFEPPLEIADQVAFGMRMAADAFIAGLGAVDLVCTELRVELDRRPGRAQRAGVAASRVVRRGSRRRPGAVAAGRRMPRAWRSGVALVRIEPEAVDAASHHAPAIFGAGTDERVHHALSRVQAMLGHRGVRDPGDRRRAVARRAAGARAVGRPGASLAKERARPVAGEPARSAAGDGLRRAACRSR